MAYGSRILAYGSRIMSRTTPVGYGGLWDEVLEGYHCREALASGKHSGWSVRAYISNGSPKRVNSIGQESKLSKPTSSNAVPP